MKNMIKKVVLTFILVTSTFQISSCERKYCERLIIDAAYETGIITVDDLKSIAYYCNNYDLKEKSEPDFDLIPMEKLSLYNKYRIKRAYLYHNDIIDNGNISNIVSFKYYGTYNGWAAVDVWDDILCHDILLDPHYVIGGVDFYNHTYIELYKID